MMFSATIPNLMSDLLAQYLRNPVRVGVARPGVAADTIARFVPKDEKSEHLISLLGGHRGNRSLVFARTKHGAERLMKKLVNAAGFEAASIHGNKSQGQRDRAIRNFRADEMSVLVATDVAARVIDIPAVKHVYNYDLPNVSENYVHRIGRTARACSSGRAVAFCSKEEIAEIWAIEKMQKTPIPVGGGESWEATRMTAAEQKSRPRRSTWRRKAIRHAA